MTKAYFEPSLDCSSIPEIAAETSFFRSEAAFAAASAPGSVQAASATRHERRAGERSFRVLLSFMGDSLSTVASDDGRDVLSSSEERRPEPGHEDETEDEERREDVPPP